MARHTCTARRARQIESLEGRTYYSAAEPNNTFEQAYTPSDNIYLEKNLVDTDSVSTTSDASDYRKFYNLYGKSHLYASLLGMSSDADLYVYDQNKNLLASSRLSGNASETINVDLPGNQYFYVRVAAYSGATNYSLYLYNDYAGATTATARDLGASWGQSSDKFWNYGKLGGEDYLDYRDNVDYVKFTMEAPGAVSLRMKDFAYSGNLVARMQLFAANGNQLSNTSGTVGNGLNLDRLNVPAGDYYVKYTQISGSDPYTFRIVSDYAGDTTATARNWGDVTRASRQAYDMVGGSFGLPTYEDATDLYKFKVTETVPVNLQLQIAQGLTPPTFDADLQLARDTNNDGFIQAGEVIASSALSGTDKINTTLTAGTYYAVVKQHGAYTSYQLDLNSDPDNVAGDAQSYKNMTKARDLGQLAGERYVRGGFGLSDISDFYKFKMETAGTFTASTTKEYARYGGVNLSIVKDANGNGKVDSGEIIKTGVSTSGNAKISASLAAGTYFLYASSNGGQTSYLLRTVSDYAGSTPSASRSVGTLTSTLRTFKDYIEQPQPSGDNTDVYKFVLTTAKTVTIKTTGVAGEDLLLQLARDVNHNNVFESSEYIKVSNVNNSPNETIIQNLAAGTYYVRVAGKNGLTNYNLTMKTN